MTAAISGITDVDAITLSLSRLADNPALLPVAALGVLIAAVVNTLVKWLMTVAIAGGVMARYVGVGFALILVAGAMGFVVRSLVV